MLLWYWSLRFVFCFFIFWQRASPWIDLHYRDMCVRCAWRAMDWERREREGSDESNKAVQQYSCAIISLVADWSNPRSRLADRWNISCCKPEWCNVLSRQADWSNPQCRQAGCPYPQSRQAELVRIPSLAEVKKQVQTSEHSTIHRYSRHGQIQIPSPESFPVLVGRSHAYFYRAFYPVLSLLHVLLFVLYRYRALIWIYIFNFFAWTQRLFTVISYKK